MLRLAALLLCALAALVATATPALDPKPRVTGWDKPVDPIGDCGFEWERLTITVPGKGHELDVSSGVLNAPHLVRAVEGDFIAEVRVSVDSWPLDQKTGSRRAGIVLIGDEKTPVAALQYGWEGEVKAGDWYFLDAKDHPEAGQTGCVYRCNAFPPRRSSYLRVARRKDVLLMSFSKDRERWTEVGSLKKRLPQKLRVGVVAEATIEGEFKATFDKFRLSRPGN